MRCKNGISERDIPGHVRQIAPKFQDGIRAFADSPIIGEVRVYISELVFIVQIHDYSDPVLQIRGLGMIMGTEFSDNKSPTDLFPAEWGKQVQQLVHNET